MHLKAKFPHQVVINEVGIRGWEDVGDQGSEGPALTGEHVLLVVVAVLVTGCKYRLGFGLVVEHLWLVQFRGLDSVPPPLSLGPGLED